MCFWEVVNLGIEILNAFVTKLILFTQMIKFVAKGTIFICTCISAKPTEEKVLM